MDDRLAGRRAVKSRTWRGMRGAIHRCMTKIDDSLLSAVIGGACLQPGATADSPNPITSKCDSDVGLQPGATADSVKPIVHRRPFSIGLQPGSTR